MVLPSNSLYARAFAADSETERVLRAGLAGHEVKIQRAKFPAALRALSVEPAPKLVFVDLDGIEAPEAAARELAAVSVPETVLVAIGSEDSASFSRLLFLNGVADYLVKPISPLMVRETSAAISEDIPDRSHAGRVIAFAGSAGCGTSTLLAEMARRLATDGRSASIVDLDPLSGKLSFQFGVESNPGLPALLDALDEYGHRASGSPQSEEAAALERLDGVSAAAAPGISLFAFSPVEPVPPSPSSVSISRLLELLANRTHVVLATGFLDPNVRIDTMRQADARVLIFEPTLASIRTAARNLGLLGPDRPATLVQSCSRSPRSALSSSHIRYAFAERNPDAVIPFDRAFQADGSPAKPGRAYRKAVLRVIGHVMERAGSQSS